MEAGIATQNIRAERQKRPRKALAVGRWVAPPSSSRTGQRLLGKVRSSFFWKSRSIRTVANSFLTRASSSSTSVRGRRFLPTLPRLPARTTLTQFSRVLSGKERRLAASPEESPSSSTKRAASSRNSFVYLPCGIFSMATPPLLSMNHQSFGVHYFQPTSHLVFSCSSTHDSMH